MSPNLVESPAARTEDLAEAHIDLLKRAVTCELYAEYEFRKFKQNNALRRFLTRMGRRFGIRLTSTELFTDEQRAEGKGVTPMAATSIGWKRIDSLHECIRTVVNDGIPGDLIETGVWRGGAVIFMRGALNAYGQHDRKVWAADSFEGLPKPDLAKYPKDQGSRWHTRSELAISLEDVQETCRRFGLLEGIHFLKGWFKDTLPDAPIEKLAIARLDGDMYGSTMDALTALYDRVSPGGFVIIDDFSVNNCRMAVEDFRKERSISEPLQEIDWTGVFWRKSH